MLMLAAADNAHHHHSHHHHHQGRLQQVAGPKQDPPLGRPQSEMSRNQLAAGPNYF